MSMKHEELCSIVNDPSHVDDWSDCQCILIDQVRDQAIKDCIAALYSDCHHTKIVGCNPCTHDVSVCLLEPLMTDKP